MPLPRSNEYGGADVEAYKTDGYSGNDADVDNTERFTADVDLTVNTGAKLHFKFDGTNATDDLILTIYNRNDAEWTGNEQAWKAALTVANDGTETEYHYVIPPAYGAGHYRFGMKSEGATSTFEMEVNLRTWRITEAIS